MKTTPLTHMQTTVTIVKTKVMTMRLLILGMLLASSAAIAAPRPNPLAATTPENIPSVAGAVSNIFVSPSTVVTVTVPYFADSYIASGDPLWVCDQPTRCGSTFPTGTVSVTGWVFNPQARNLQGNLQVSTSLIYVYARPQDIVSGTNVGAFEWSYRQQAN